MTPPIPPHHNRPDQQTNMSTFRIVDADIDPEAYHDHLAAMVRRGRLTALLGSGISTWEPSNLPAGQEITRALAEALIPSSTAPIGTIRGLIERSAFEHVMFRYPKHDRLRGVLSETFNPAPANPVHECFARLLDRGVIEHIITTNYDLGIEKACSSICRPSRKPQVIVISTDVTGIDWSKPVIFKIHGCASTGRSRSIIANYEEEGELPQWKRELLTALLGMHDLLVCGYSGYDFEICPELVSINPRALHWNSFDNPDIKPDALTANAQRVLHAVKDATVIAGDMVKMLGTLDNPFRAKRAVGSAGGFVKRLVDELLKDEPDDWQYDHWRIWALNGTGCSVEGIEIGRQMIIKSGDSAQRKMDSLFALAESLFHGGFYRQSASAYSQVAQAALNLGDVEKRIQAEINVAECERTAGQWLRAWLKLRKAINLPASLADPEKRHKADGAIALKRVLLLQNLYQIVGLLGLHFIKARIRGAAKINLSIVADTSRGGSWFDFQLCEMLAKRFELDFDEIYRGPLTPLPSRAGYRQIGYFIGEMLALRDELLKPDTEVEPAIFRNIDIAHEIGCHPIVWKLSRAVERKVPVTDLPPGFIARRRQAWEACEYTLLMRLFLIILWSRYK